MKFHLYRIILIWELTDFTGEVTNALFNYFTPHFVKIWISQIKWLKTVATSAPLRAERSIDEYLQVRVCAYTSKTLRPGWNYKNVIKKKLSRSKCKMFIDIKLHFKFSPLEFWAEIKVAIDWALIFFCTVILDIDDSYCFNFIVIQNMVARSHDFFFNLKVFPGKFYYYINIAKIFLFFHENLKKKRDQNQHTFSFSINRLKINYDGR